MDAELMSLRDVAQYLRMNERSVGQLVHKGELPAQKFPRGWRVSRTAVEAWLASHPPKPTAVGPTPTADSGMPVAGTLAAVMDVGRMNLKLQGTDKDSVLRELVGLVIDPVQKRSAEIFYQALKAREDLCSTCVNEGIAIPHARNALVGLVDHSLLAYARHSGGVEFGAMDGKPVHHFFLLCAPSVREHLQILARLARVINNPAFRDRLHTADSPQAVIDAVSNAEKSIPIR